MDESSLSAGSVSGILFSDDGVSSGALSTEFLSDEIIDITSGFEARELMTEDRDERSGMVGELFSCMVRTSFSY